MTGHRVDVPHLSRVSGVLLVIAGLLAGGLIVGALFYRAYVNAHRQKLVGATDMHLCQVIRAIVAESDPRKLGPGDPGYSYYSVHPDELERSIGTYEHTLSRLRCAYLPTTRGS